MEATNSKIGEPPNGGGDGSHSSGLWLPTWGRKLLAGNPFYLGLWVTGSAAHLYCVGYVSDLTFHLWMLAPLALVLAWTAWHRLTDLLPQPVPARAGLRHALFCSAALTPLVAMTAPSIRFLRGSLD